MLRSDCKEIWKKARTFSDLQRGMVLYLEGVCTANPWMAEPVDKETVPLLQTLIQINRRGFVTTQGQPGTISTKRIGIPDSDLGSIGEEYTEIQRGYMDGFILNRDVDRFCERLIATERVVIHLERLDFRREMLGDVSEDMFVTARSGRSVISLSQEVSKNGEVSNYHTNFEIPFTPGDEGLAFPNRHLKKFLKKNCTYLSIIMKKQGDDTLDKLVLECL